MTKLVTFVCFALSIACGSHAERAYAPKRKPAILESWRWSVLEAMKGKPVVCAGIDDSGVLWLGTTGGLASYDGMEYSDYPYPDLAVWGLPSGVLPTGSAIVYVTTTNGLFSLKDGNWERLLAYETIPSVRNIKAGKAADGSVFLGTPSGMVKLSGGEMKVYPSFPRNIVTALVDAEQTLWFSTLDDGLVYACSLEDEENFGNPSTWKIYETTPGQRPQRTVLYERSSGELWAVNSLADCPPLVFDRRSETWERKGDGFGGITSHDHEDLIEAADGSLLIHTRNSLLLEGADGWTALKHPDFKIPSSTPFMLNMRDGALVMGARGDTTSKIDMTRDSWDALSGLHFQCVDLRQWQWFIARSGGIVRYEPDFDQWTIFDESDGIIDAATALFLSSDGTVWATGSHSGEAAVASFENNRWTPRLHPELGSRISHLSACETKDGAILFGAGNLPYEETSTSGGMVKYVRRGDSFVVERLARPEYPERIVGIVEGSDSELWLGGEILKLSKDGVTTLISEPSYLNNIWIDHLLRSKEGDLWLAIGGVGVARLCDGQWRLFTEEDGLVSNQVVYLLEDITLPGHIWAATDAGVSYFDGKSWTEALFPSSFAVNRESGTLKQMPDGSLWINFGDRNWFFHSERDALENAQEGQSFRTIRYRRQGQGPSTELLDYEARLAEPGYPYFSWRGKDQWSRTSKGFLEYSYRLNDEDWSDFSRATETILLQVKPGEHRFEVRARDGDGNLEEAPQTAYFTVVPPLWKRTWFVLAVAFVAVSMATLVYIIIQQRIRRIIEVEEFKIQFFTNLSHELRTPLTVIIGPLERLVAKLDSGLPNDLLLLALKNARKMNHIVDQLLDFRKTESVKMPEEKVKDDLVQFTRSEIELHLPLTQENGQRMEFESNLETYGTWLDFDKFDKILGNLLSNAIKFTPNGGVIRVYLKIDDGHSLTLSVEDEGPGIPKREQSKIFEPFYQSQKQQGTHRIGTGIGLALAKGLANACCGDIAVESPIESGADVPIGSRFILTLPLKFAAEANIANAEEPDSNAPESIGDTDEVEEIGVSVLVVDDSDDVRSFLASELRDEYTVFEARNGEEGLEIAKSRLPDLIVSDVMMPILDGNEFCRRIKDCEATCHIPVIMLTAHKAAKQELASLTIGADDYIGKPVNFEILKRRIQNLIASREQLRRMFSESGASLELIPSDAAVQKRDRLYLEKARKVITDNLRNSQFDVEFFSEKMAMSRMTLYRKLKALTGMSPNEFIRSVRLKMAASLLKSGKYKVTDVADHVGYQELSYFSSCFKKQFGCSPSEYGKRDEG